LNISSLPDIQFLDTNPIQIKDAIIRTYEALSDKKLYDGDPVRLFLLSVADIIIHQQVLINETALQNLLRYSRDAVLDHKGDLLSTYRMQQSSAATTVRWWVSAPRQEVIVIPKGKRVSPEDGIFFVTTETVQIQPGELYADVVCECLEPGKIGNDFLPGKINQIVDPMPWIERAENITKSAGGADKEEDSSYRERIREAPEAFSSAGPSGAYKFHAKSTHPEIEDVYVYSPSPGCAELRVLLTEGRIPTQEILDAVYNKCNDRKVRPLTDRVQVLPAEEIKYNLDMTYWIDVENVDRIESINAEVQKAVEEFIVWQRSKLGRDINPSELTLKVRLAGAYRVEIRSPVFTNVSRYQFASVNTKNVVYGGIVDDES